MVERVLLGRWRSSKSAREKTMLSSRIGVFNDNRQRGGGGECQSMEVGLVMAERMKRWTHPDRCG